MFEDKITAGSTLAGPDRRRLKQAYQDGDSNRSSRLRIFLLALLAVLGVMLFTQAMLEAGADVGDKLAARLFDRAA